MNEDALLEALAAGRLLQTTTGPDGARRVRLFDPADAEGALRAFGSPDVRGTLSIADEDTLAAIGDRQAVDRERESLRRNLGDVGTGALSFGTNLVSGALTLGQLDNIAQALSPTPEFTRRRIQALAEETPVISTAGQVAGAILPAAATGGATSFARAGLAGATPAGAAQVLTNQLERYLLRQAASRGIQGGGRRFLATLGARSTANVLVGTGDLLAGEGARYAITGEPIDAEGLMQGGLLTAGLGIGLEGLVAVGRAGRQGLHAARLRRGGLRPRDAGLVPDAGPGGPRPSSGPDARPLDQRLADSTLFEPVPPEYQGGPDILYRTSAVAGGLDPEQGARTIRQQIASPHAADPTLRTRQARAVGENINTLLDETDEVLRPVTDPARRRAVYDDVGSRLGEAADIEAGDAIRQRLREAIDEHLGTIEAASGPQRNAMFRVWSALDDIASSPPNGTRPRGFAGADSVASRIDAVIDRAGQENWVGGARTGFGSDVAVQTVRDLLEQAGSVMNYADGPISRISPAEFASTQRAQRALLELRTNNKFLDRLTQTSGRNRPRVDVRALEQNFNTDALAAFSTLGREETRAWLGQLNEAVESARALDPSNPRLGEMQDRISAVAGDLRSLAELSEIQANLRLAQSAEGKTGGLIAGLQAPGPLAGAAVGGALGGIPGAIVGGALGLGLQSMFHPTSVVRRAIGIRQLFGGAETRAARGVERVRATMRGTGSALKTSPLGLGFDRSALPSSLPRAVSALYDPETRDEAYADLRETLDRLVASPDALLGAASDITAPLGELNPELESQAAGTFVRGAVYLHGSLPPLPRGLDPYSSLRNHRPPVAAINAIARRLHVVADPLAVLDLVAEGRLQPDHVEALSAVYPAIHARVAAAVASMIADADELPPYAVRRQLDLLTGAQSEPLLDPAAIDRLQTRAAQTSMQQQQRPGQRGQIPRVSASASSRVSDGLQTSTQRITLGL